MPGMLRAQLDPEHRRLLQFGYNQPLEGKGPIAGYGFYYYNQPNLRVTNLTLRVVAAPIYLDTELGFRGLLGANTDLAIGLAGGGFADTYSEIRDGHYYEDESFIGHGGDASASVYHLFNPGQVVPLWLTVRGTVGLSYYVRDTGTDPNFVLPSNRANYRIRSGLRWGGEEPSLTEPLAMELSVWEESRFRSPSGSYGFNNDRAVEAASHLFWARGLMKYMFENELFLGLSVTAGTSVDADRFSAYRLGGVLPFVSEFPLSIPGYYYQEISAKQFVVVDGQYSFPLTPKKNWRFTCYGGTARVSYLEGLEQPGRWHSGLGGGLSFISPSGTWMFTAIYAHGFDAIRSHGVGANQIAVLFQWDFDAKKRGKSRFFAPGMNPYRSRGGEKLFRD